jgi:hypothetical protein
MRRFLIGIACLSLLNADDRRWKLHPAVDAAVQRIKIGELTSIRGAEPVVGALDLPSWEDYLKAQKANDKEGIKELLDEGRIALLSRETSLRVLERNEAALDKLMDTVHQLLDIDKQSFKDCMGNSIRRVRAGLSPGSCDDQSFESLYNGRTSQCLGGATAEEYVDAHVLVRVRALAAADSSKKWWVLYGDLVPPSRSDASPSTPERAGPNSDLLDFRGLMRDVHPGIAKPPVHQ